jgi:hypothetical protein
LTSSACTTSTTCRLQRWRPEVCVVGPGCALCRVSPLGVWRWCGCPRVCAGVLPLLGSADQCPACAPGASPLGYPPVRCVPAGKGFWNSEDYSAPAGWGGAQTWAHDIIRCVFGRPPCRPRPPPTTHCPLPAAHAGRMRCCCAVCAVACLFGARRNYVNNNMTATIAWSTIWSVLDNLPYSPAGAFGPMCPPLARPTHSRPTPRCLAPFPPTLIIRSSHFPGP